MLSFMIGVVLIAVSLGAVVIGNSRKITWLTAVASLVGLIALCVFILPLLLKIGFYAALIGVACYVAFLIYQGLSREPS